MSSRLGFAALCAFASTAACSNPEVYQRASSDSGMSADLGVTSATGGKGGASGVSNTGGAPVSTGGAPVSTGGAPIATGGAPAATGGAPVSTGGAPMASGGAPAATGGAPVATGGAASATGGRAASGGVSGTGGAGVGGTSGAGQAGSGGATDSNLVDLVLWYPFDDATGSVAKDASGGAHHAALVSVGSGQAAFSSVHRVGTGAVDLSSIDAASGGYVAMPASLPSMGVTGAATISFWVNVRTSRAWQRAFDIGTGTTTYMFMSIDAIADADAGTLLVPKFEITTAGNKMGQDIFMTTPSALSLGTWHHIAIVLGAGTPYIGTLFIDKVAVGRNTAMTLHPADLGETTKNWIGRSQFSGSNPLFDGQIDDFRVYKRALSAAEIGALP